MYARSSFVPPMSEEFRTIFENPEALLKLVRGGSLSDIGVYNSYDHYRRGAGLFSFLGNIGKRLIPFVSRLVKPALLDFGSSVIDMREGKTNLKSSMKRRGIEAMKQVGARAMTGGGAGRNHKSKEIKGLT